MKYGYEYFPFTAVVGQNRLKRFLSMCAVTPDIGIILLRGPKHSMKSRLVKSMCHVASSASDGGENRFVIIKSYENPGMEQLSVKKYIDYCVIPSFEGYDRAWKDDFFKSWNGNENKGCQLILIENDIDSNVYNKVDFVIDVNPIDDIERRIEMVKREREFRSDKGSFIKRFKDMELEFVDRVRKARKIYEEVNTAESLRIELRENLSDHFEKMFFERPYKCVLRYARAEAAFNNRRWVSREDIESGLSYLNYQTAGKVPSPYVSD